MSRSARLAAVGVAALAVTTGYAGSVTPVRAATVRDCTPQEVHQLVLQFIRAFNKGDSAQLDTLFAADDGDGDAGTPSFQWYSTDKPGRRLGSAADDRSTLIRYLAARHRLGERLQVLSMSRGNNSNGYFDFVFWIVRRARDLPATKYEGKGAAICSGGAARIAVWSMARRALVR